MLFTSSVASAVTAANTKLRELPMPTWAFGAIALGAFLALLGVLWMFRNTAAKYDRPAGAGRGDGHESQSSHGAADPGTSH
jgi:hypothetical protein